MIKLFSLLLVVLFGGGCRGFSPEPRSSVTKNQVICEVDLSTALDIIRAFFPNARIDKVITLESNGKTHTCHVAISVNNRKKYYVITSEEIYERGRPDSGLVIKNWRVKAQNKE